MKIAVIAASQVPFSTANSIQVMKVCQALVQLGHTVCLYVPGDQTASWDALGAHYGLSNAFDVRWLHCPLVWRRYDLAWLALREARSWGASLVYTWMLQAAVLAQWKKIPVIMEMHMLPTGLLGPILFRNFVHGSGKKRILIITRALQDILEENFDFKFSLCEVQIAPMGCEPERYAGLPAPAEARNLLHLPQGVTVGYTGHLYPGRGMDILVGLARHFPGTNFLWVGGRRVDIVFWQDRLHQEGLNNIHLTGFIENQYIPLYQAAADLLVMPYQEQVGVSSGGDTSSICSPMKMFEYLAAGRPILSSDLPVLHEVLNDKNAVFCPPNDPEKWQIALGGLLEDEIKRSKLSEQARADALQYSWHDRTSRALEDFL